MRIGLLGGTFNPIHNGHMALASQAKKQLSLEKVIFIPTYIPPHKDTTELISAEDRFKMLELAISGNEGFEISRFEIERKTATYSIETLEHFKKSFPDTEIFFIIGEDSLQDLSTWREPDKLIKLCKFVSFNRPGFEALNTYPEVEKIDMAPVDVSSTEIRKKVKAGESVTGLLPEAVEKYIVSNNLYR